MPGGHPFHSMYLSWHSSCLSSPPVYLSHPMYPSFRPVDLQHRPIRLRLLPPPPPPPLSPPPPIHLPPLRPIHLHPPRPIHLHLLHPIHLHLHPIHLHL